MKDVRVALAQVPPKLGSPDANLELHETYARKASERGADIVAFPELSLTGYLLRDQVPDVAIRQGDSRFARLARCSREVDVVAGFVEEAPGHRFYNSAAYFSGGQLLHLHRKVYLPTYGLFEEGRDFAAGDSVRAFETPFGPCGILICEDLWHPPSAWLLAQQGAEAIFVLSNGPTRGTRPGSGITSVGVWNGLLEVTAPFLTAFLVYVNRCGCEDGLTFGGASRVLDPFGRTVVALPELTEHIDVATLDADVLRRARVAYPLLRDERLDLVHRELGRLRRIRYDLGPSTTPDELESGRSDWPGEGETP